MKNRDCRIDIMRVIGTFMVIFAHMEIPTFLQNGRTFDVTMLFFISGISFALSYNKNLTFGEYLKKRLKKLLIPTYYLLIVLFGVSFIVCFLLKRDQLFSIESISHSFLFLNDGIGYIWIVRVYLFIAVFLFFTKRIIDTHKYSNEIIFLLLGLFIVWIVCSTFLYGKNVIFDSYVMEVIPYCFVAFLGMICACKKRGLNIILIVSTSIFAVIQMLNICTFEGFCPDNYKYPPTIYYLSYGIMVTVLFIKILPNKRNGIIEWFSKNSFLIYLCHILFLFGFNLVSEISIFGFLQLWWIKYIIIMLCSICLCLLLNRIRIGENKKDEFVAKD